MNAHVPNHIMWLAKGPNNVAKRYNGYFINGHRFHTRKRDAKCKTQNSGVTLQALTPSFESSRDQNPITGDVTYYGAIDEIIEIDFWDCSSVILFKCDWFQSEKDEDGLTCVNINKLCYLDDPFVLASKCIKFSMWKILLKNGVTMKYDAITHLDDNISFRWARKDTPTNTHELPPHIFGEPPLFNEIEEDSDVDDADRIG
ncbi:hypothetical protein GH714_011784 [Hevea brasiliensis]|uniref:DUF4216 domain-containing protein n=1 Tax=Hevea brasiliensis TaxID=3981 RepID=A0A6A6LND5_HEVBR|nr:hypothetical protein GH714_011784 [Hevea brasiliensis]